MAVERMGATWVRAALQVNPYAYKGAGAPSLSFNSESDYNRALVEELQRLGVSLIAVTDHWSARSAVSLIEACSAAGIVALPGFEANTRESIHVLVIFPVGTAMGDMDAAIGACGASPGCESSITGESLGAVVDKMTRKGAIVIASHVNATAGLLTRLSGQAKFGAWQLPNLGAAGVSPGVPLSVDDQSIVDGRHPECVRQHSLAVIHADDVSHPNRLGQAGATSWFKMSTLSLESLRIALRACATRVRLEPILDTGYPRIVGIEWVGGYLDQMSLPFSDSLTALIGGRGAGKSTVVESLRYALDCPPIGARALKDYKAVIERVLQAATTVRVTFNVGSPTFNMYLVERTVPDPPIVRDSSGIALKQGPKDLLGQLEVFSQHELAELADDQIYMARMLGRFADPDADEERRLVVRDLLRDNRKEQLGLMRQITALEERVADLPRLREQLLEFQSRGVDDRLLAQDNLRREAAIFDAAYQQVERVESLASQLTAGAIPDRGRLDPESIAALPRSGKLMEAVAAVQRLETAVDGAVAGLAEAIVESRAELAEVKQAWEGDTEPIRLQYAQTIRELRDAGLDAPKYLGLGAKIEELSRQENDRTQLAAKLNSLQEKRRQLLAEHNQLYNVAYDRLRIAATAANKMVRNRVVVRPKRSSDRRPLRALVESCVAGQRGQIMAAIDSADFSVPQFVKSCREGIPSVKTQLNINENQARALCEAGEELFLEFEEFQADLAAEAQLNVAAQGAPRYRPLADLSKGQKATALLMLLLTESRHPLVIDQPEDNLDNRFIFDGVVDRLRNLKGARQMIFATHNANVPVLGDAELVAVMEGSDQRGGFAEDGLGSIDEPAIRNSIELLLEGGRDAFEARRHLYGY